MELPLLARVMFQKSACQIYCVMYIMAVVAHLPLIEHMLY